MRRRVWLSSSLACPLFFVFLLGIAFSSPWLWNKKPDTRQEANMVFSFAVFFSHASDIGDVSEERNSIIIVTFFLRVFCFDLTCCGIILVSIA